MVESEGQELDRESEIYDEFMMSKESESGEHSFKITQIDDTSFKYVCDVNVAWESLDRSKKVKFDKPSELQDFLDLNKYDQADIAKDRLTDHDWYVENINIGTKVGFIVTVDCLGGEETEVYIEETLKNRSDLHRLSQLLSKTDNSDSIHTDYESDNIGLTYLEDEESFVIKTQNYEFKGDKADENWMGIARDKDKIPNALYNYIKNGKRCVQMKIKKPLYKEKDNLILVTLEKDNFSVQLKFEEPTDNEKLKKLTDVFGGGDLILIENSQVYLSHKTLSYTSDAVISQDGWNIHKKKPKARNENVKQFLRRIKFW